MEIKRILTRDNEPTDELRRIVTKVFKGTELNYTEVYYLDYEVDENTGNINKGKKNCYYTKGQMERNLKSLKSEYHIAKGAASPKEIIEFREKYHIAASTFSAVLGFSKNTISNIENSGVTSLPSGRLIKVVINNNRIMYQYINSCDTIEKERKEELSSFFA